MDYEGQICRSPMERGSYMLPVALGCSYKACKFCMLFKHLNHTQLPLEKIQAELERVYSAGAKPKHIFLGDGNAFTLPAHRLLEILEMIRRYFPCCTQVNMDATVSDIACKSADELTRLHAAGVRCLYIGIESGLEDALCFMNKDHSLTQAYEQIARLDRVGIRYAAHIMTGVAGEGRCMENAEATAEFLSRTKPQSITNFSMFVEKKAPPVAGCAGRALPSCIGAGDSYGGAEAHHVSGDRELKL